MHKVSSRRKMWSSPTSYHFAPLSPPSVADAKTSGQASLSCYWRPGKGSESSFLPPAAIFFVNESCRSLVWCVCCWVGLPDYVLGEVGGVNLAAYVPASLRQFLSVRWRQGPAAYVIRGIWSLKRQARREARPKTPKKTAVWFWLPLGGVILITERNVREAEEWDLMSFF